MNIFALDNDPKIAAQWHVDRHVIKMSTEYTQQLSAAYYNSIGIQTNKAASENWDLVLNRFSGWPRHDENGQVKPYRISHFNHPCTKWTRTSIQNFDWFHSLATELAIEFTARYGKSHAVRPLLDWMKSNPPNLPNIGQTPFAQTIPVCFRGPDAVAAYRDYYCFKDSIMQMSWKIPIRRPSWFTAIGIEQNVKRYNDFTGGIPEQQLADVDSMHNAQSNIKSSGSPSDLSIL